MKFYKNDLCEMSDFKKGFELMKQYKHYNFFLYNLSCHKPIFFIDL